MAENATVLERCDIQPSPETAAELTLPQPSPETAAELTLPLVHFEITFIFFHPIQRLLFFEFPCSKTYFINTVVPNLKKSLAQSLAKFQPLAGKIVIPHAMGKPSCRFVAGDAVSLTVAECDKDFDDLIGNQPRVADDFYGCVAQLPAAERSENEAVFPVFALQITLFPGRGLCLGFTNDHAVGDASLIVRFIKYWASVNKFVGNADITGGESLSSYDRSTVEDSEGLDSIYWSITKESRPMESAATSFPINEFRSTFVLSNADIQKLKRFVLERRPASSVTSFTVACALAWVCLVKAEPPGPPAKADDDAIEYLVFPAECCARLEPPLPAAYLGNCLALVKAGLAHGTLKGGDGIAAAADSIGKAIEKTVNNKMGFLHGAETWLSDFAKLIGKRLFGVAGSPRFDPYEVDYGWGRPAKYESASIYADKSMSLCKSRDLEGGLEIGLSRRKDVLDAFSAHLQDELEKL